MNGEKAGWGRVRSWRGGRQIQLQEIAKLLDGQSGITNDTAECTGVDRVMTWNREDARAVRHDNMFSLAGNGKFCFLQRSHRIEVADARNL